MATLCYCGGTFTQTNEAHHRNTNKHKYYNNPCARIIDLYNQLSNKEKNNFKIHIMGLYKEEDDENEIII